MAKETETSPQKVIAKSIQERLNGFLSKEKGIKTACSDESKRLKTGIDTLDAILGGGIIVGGIIQLVGRAGCGKSSLAAKIIGSFQQQSDGDALAIYIDAESTMSKFRLAQLGVNNPPIEPVVDVTLEDVFNVIESVIEFKKDNKDTKDIPTVIVWDSIANTITKKEMTAEDPKEVIGYKARMLSLYLPKITAALPEYNITLIAINQMRDSVGIGMMPSPVAIKGMKQSDTIPGGRTLQFATSQLIYMTDVGNIEEKTYGFDGKEVECYCIKNKAFPPLVKTKTTFSYMGGYSNFWSSFSMLKAQKLIVVGGAWYSIKGYEKKFQASKVTQLYSESEEFRKAFDDNINTYLIGLADKYTNQLESCNIDNMIDKSKSKAIGVSLIEEAKKLKVDLPIVEPPKEQEVKDTDKVTKSESKKIEKTKTVESVKDIPVPVSVSTTQDLVI